MQPLHPSRVRRALDGAALSDVLRDRATAARVARRLGTTPAHLIRALRRMTALELAAVEDPAVEDPAVEDPAVEDPAVEDPAVATLEGRSPDPSDDVVDEVMQWLDDVIDERDELPPEPAEPPDLAELARDRLAARAERIKLWRAIEGLRAACAGQRERLEELTRHVRELEEENEALRERVDFLLQR